MEDLKVKGICYCCGAQYSKAGFQKHLTTAHAEASGQTQECALIRVESCYPQGYWLYLDIPLTSTLGTLDKFLRDIWLECCGHMSVFLYRHWQVGKATKIGSYPSKTVLHYEYDMGDTTELKLTFCGTTVRPKQRRSVRVLARNLPPEVTCKSCGNPATLVCPECKWDDYDGNPYLCEACFETHDHDDCRPVVNSPRMGVCGYTGEFDIYQFVPEDFEM